MRAGLQHRPDRDRPAAGAHIVRWFGLWGLLIGRYWRREPLSTLALVSLLAIGSGSVLAIQATNRAAVSEFADFTSTFSGGSDFVLRPLEQGFASSLPAALREHLGAEPVTIAPVAETRAALWSIGGQAQAAAQEPPPLVRFMGLDLVAARNYVTGAEALDWSWLEGSDDTFWLSTPSALPRAYVSPVLARRHGLKIDQALVLRVQQDEVTLRVAGILPERVGSQWTPEDLVLSDMADWLEHVPRERPLARLEVSVAPGPEVGPRRAALAERLDALADAGAFRVETQTERRERGALMTAAFRYNLLLLALIAYIGAAFLVAQALNQAVVRRQREIGTLKLLGWRSGAIQRLWLSEGLSLGLAGLLLSLPLGWLLAQGALGLVSPTVALLYEAGSARSVALEQTDLLWLLGLGSLGSLLASYWPARKAARTPPVVLLGEGYASRSGTRFGPLLPGLGLLGVAAAAALAPPWQTPSGATLPLGGYVATVALLLGATCCLGPLIARLASVQPLRAAGGAGTAALCFAARRLRHSGSRHTLAGASLVVAAAILIAMTQVLASFEHSLTTWMETRFGADAYVTTWTGAQADASEGLDRASLQALAEVPGVAGVMPLYQASLPWRGGQVELWGGDLRQWLDRESLRWVDPPSAAGTHAQLWVSESLALKAGLSVGDRIELPLNSVSNTWVLSGIFRDFAAPAGAFMLDSSVFDQAFPGASAAYAGLYLDAETGRDAPAALDRLRADFPLLAFTATASLKERSLELFRTVFRITDALLIIALVLALGGMSMGLWAILREDRAHWQYWSELGARPWQLKAAGAWEALLLAAASLAVGTAASFGLVALLLRVINPQAFGWTLAWQVPWLPVLTYLALVLVLSAVLGYVTAQRAALSPRHAR